MIQQGTHPKTPQCEGFISFRLCRRRIMVLLDRINGLRFCLLFCCSFQLRQHNPQRGAAVDANGLRQLHPERLPGEHIRDGSGRGVHSNCRHLLLRLRIAVALRPRDEGVHHRHWGACNCSTWGYIPHHQIIARTKPQPLSPRILALCHTTSLSRLHHRCRCCTHPALLIQA